MTWSPVDIDWETLRQISATQTWSSQRPQPSFPIQAVQWAITPTVYETQILMKRNLFLMINSHCLMIHFLPWS